LACGAERTTAAPISRIEASARGLARGGGSNKPGSAVGPQKAIAEAYVHNSELVFWYFRRRVRDTEVARDLTQDVFVALIEGGPVGVTSAEMRRWLLTVAHHRFVDWVRRSRSRPVCVTLSDAAALASRDRFERISVDLLMSSIAALPPSLRPVVVLRLIYGLSFAEIADQVHSTENACRTRFRRGLETLRQTL
jgi:RNA polymerase sigma-70 factor (ECF subfamily)